MNDLERKSWSVSGIRTKIGGMPALTISGNDESNIFVLYGDGSDKEHRKAYQDARLIAAAPDMLEALDLLIKMFDTPIARRKIYTDITYESVDFAKEAIRKAKGE